MQFLYVGTEQGLEQQIAPKSGYAFRSIEVVGWQRKSVGKLSKPA